MNKIFKKTGLAGLIVSTMVVTGCSTTGNSAVSSVNAAEVNSVADLERRVKELDEREAELNARANRVGVAADNNLPADAAGLNDLLPPNAVPGECYARVWVDAQYTTTTEQVLASEASSRINIIPAQYETVEETVLVSAASSRLETIPAVYGTESETIKVREGERKWRVGLDGQDAPASQALLAAASAHGIDIDAAQPGMCFHEHYVPATYRTVTEQVVTQAQTENVTIVPAQYEMVEESVLVREASSKLVTVPAEYGTEEERILDKPAHTVWKKGTGPIQKIDEATGEIMCLVEVPATYKTVTRRVLRSPARTETVEIPAEYKTVQVRKLVSSAAEQREVVPAVYGQVDRQVVDQDAGFVWHEISNKEHPESTRTGNKICLTETAPQYKTVTKRVVETAAQTRTIEIPAEYNTVKVTKLVTPAREEVIEIPAEYRTVDKRELVRDGYMAWRSILCETNMTTSRISDIQRALNEAGHDVGTPDGVIGEQTIRAINDFQRANNLPVDKYINVDTLKALGVSPN